MQHDESAVLGGNATLIHALALARDALDAATDTIDDVGGGTESVYQTLYDCHAAIDREIAALFLVDALGNREARP